MKAATCSSRGKNIVRRNVAAGSCLLQNCLASPSSVLLDDTGPNTGTEACNHVL